MKSKRHQILQAAIKTVSLYGYRRTSMEDIANEAGVSRPAIYQHFRNKEALALSALEMIKEQGFEVAEQAAKDAPKGKELSAFLTAFMTFYFKVLFAGPHAEELMQMRAEIDGDGSLAVRERLVLRVNEMLGNAADDETGFVLATAAEGIKLAAPDVEKLASRIAMLVGRFV